MEDLIVSNPNAVVPVEDRLTYFKTLEEANVQQNIIPFAQFIAKCVANTGNNKPIIQFQEGEEER